MFYTNHEKYISKQFKLDIKNYLRVCKLEASGLLFCFFSLCFLFEFSGNFESVFIFTIFTVISIYLIACLIKSFIITTSIDEKLCYPRVSNSPTYKCFVKFNKVVLPLVVIFDIAIIMNGLAQSPSPVGDFRLLAQEDYELINATLILSICVRAVLFGYMTSLLVGLLHIPIIVAIYTMLTGISFSREVDVVRIVDYKSGKGVISKGSEFYLIFSSFLFSVEKCGLLLTVFFLLLMMCDLLFKLNIDLSVVILVLSHFISVAIPFYGFYYYARTLKINHSVSS